MSGLVEHYEPRQVAGPALVLWIDGREYQATLIGQAPDGERFVRLQRGGPKPAAYDVWVDATGIFRCNCPDYTYRREGLSAEPCKHGRRVRDVGILTPEDRRK